MRKSQVRASGSAFTSQVGCNTFGSLRDLSDETRIESSHRRRHLLESKRTRSSTSNQTPACQRKFTHQHSPWRRSQSMLRMVGPDCSGVTIRTRSGTERKWGKMQPVPMRILSLLTSGRSVHGEFLTWSGTSTWFPTGKLIGQTLRKWYRTERASMACCLTIFADYADIN